MWTNSEEVKLFEKNDGNKIIVGYVAPWVRKTYTRTIDSPGADRHKTYTWRISLTVNGVVFTNYGDGDYSSKKRCEDRMLEVANSL